MKHHTKRSTNKGFQITLILLIFILFAVSGFLIYTVMLNKINSSVSSVPPNSQSSDFIVYNGENYYYNNNLINILFMGIDKDDPIKTHTPGFSGQSDTLIILSFNKKTQELSLLPISRDTVTDIDLYDTTGNYYDTTTAPIALQYSYNNGKKASCWTTKRTVSKFLYELPIDYYISINMSAIPIVNDYLGGVTVTVPKNYSKIDSSFKKGKKITLKGGKTQKYIRYRDTNTVGSNNDRMARQLDYLKAFFPTFRRKMVSRDDYDNLYSDISSYMVTDISVTELYNLLKDNYKLGKILSIPGKTIKGKKYDEFHADENRLKALLIKTFYIKQ